MIKGDKDEVGSVGNSYARNGSRRGTLCRDCLDHILILGGQYPAGGAGRVRRRYNECRLNRDLRQETPLRQVGRVVDTTPESSTVRLCTGISRPLSSSVQVVIH